MQPDLVTLRFGLEGSEDWVQHTDAPNIHCARAIPKESFDHIQCFRARLATLSADVDKDHTACIVSRVVKRYGGGERPVAPKRRWPLLPFVRQRGKFACKPPISDASAICIIHVSWLSARRAGKELNMKAGAEYEQFVYEKLKGFFVDA
jgi:hypothetical protein